MGQYCYCQNTSQTLGKLTHSVGGMSGYVHTYYKVNAILLFFTNYKGFCITKGSD